METNPQNKSVLSRDNLDEYFLALTEQLRDLATKKSPGHSLNATALINDLYVKLANSSELKAADHEHFLALAATAMRQIVVDRYKARGSLKRGGGWHQTHLDNVVDTLSHSHGDLVDLDMALNKLEVYDKRKAQLVELRFFAQLPLKTAADALGISEATAKRDWVIAKGLLFQYISQLES